MICRQAAVTKASKNAKEAKDLAQNEEITEAAKSGAGKRQKRDRSATPDVGALLTLDPDEDSDGGHSVASSSRRASVKSSVSSEASLETQIGNFLESSMVTPLEKKRRISIEEQRLALEKERIDNERQRIENDRADRAAQRENERLAQANMSAQMAMLSKVLQAVVAQKASI